MYRCVWVQFILYLFGLKTGTDAVVYKKGNRGINATKKSGFPATKQVDFVFLRDLKSGC